jgi:hypothetical protein
MFDSYVFPYVCPAKHFPFSDCLIYLQVVMSHSDLHHDEKCLWVWLASHCANQPHHACSFTYEQLSRAMNLTPKKVHSALFRLKLMGVCVPQVQSELQNSQALSFIEDEGRSFEIGFQEQVSNHLKQPLSKATVVSIEEKSKFNLAGRDQKDE